MLVAIAAMYMLKTASASTALNVVCTIVANTKERLESRHALRFIGKLGLDSPPLPSPRLASPPLPPSLPPAFLSLSAVSSHGRRQLHVHMRMHPCMCMIMYVYI